MIIVGCLSHNVKPLDAYLILGLTAVIRTILKARIAGIPSVKLDPILPCGMSLIAATGLGMGTGSESWDIISRNAAWTLFGLFYGFALISDCRLLERRYPHGGTPKSN